LEKSIECLFEKSSKTAKNKDIIPKDSNSSNANNMEMVQSESNQQMTSIQDQQHVEDLLRLWRVAFEPVTAPMFIVKGDKIVFANRTARFWMKQNDFPRNISACLFVDWIEQGCQWRIKEWSRISDQDLNWNANVTIPSDNQNQIILTVWSATITRNPNGNALAAVFQFVIFDNNETLQPISTTNDTSSEPETKNTNEEKEESDQQTSTSTQTSNKFGKG